MKKHHLIFLSTIVFMVLFYEQEIGLNWGIFGFVLCGFIPYQTNKKNRNFAFWTLLVMSVLSLLAFSWYGDFVSFLASFISLILLQFKARNRNLKAIFALPVAFFTGGSFIVRFFDFQDWISIKAFRNITFGHIVSVIIPLVFFMLFFIVYSSGSSILSEIYLYRLDMDLDEFLLVLGFGFFLSFNFWNLFISRYLLKQNRFFQNAFSEKSKKGNSFLELDFMNDDIEIKSGELTFFLLNGLLLIFIFVFNYEQFFEVKNKAHELSNGIHERVNMVILSIVMAVLVIMYYFRSRLNFSEKSNRLKFLAKIWVIFNAILVFSSLVKNTEYILYLGLTYKRLGVYAFLILCLIGLVFTFNKIQYQKTNIYLFNQMIWYFYGTLLLCSVINWGYLATLYNIENQKGSSFDDITDFDYNDELILENYPQYYDTFNIENIEKEKEKPFLSKVLYYQFIQLKNNK